MLNVFFWTRIKQTMYVIRGYLKGCFCRRYAGGQYVPIIKTKPSKFQFIACKLNILSILRITLQKQSSPVSVEKDLNITVRVHFEGRNIWQIVSSILKESSVLPASVIHV